ncbi:MAG: hypothetical protein ACR2O6_11135 [Ilumatobacteraceae bacterium]
MPDRGAARIFGVGLAVSALGFRLIRRSGGLEAIQRATTPEEFVVAARSHGNRLRAANLADIAVFVPGYVLLGAGWMALLRRWRPQSGSIAEATRGIFGLVLFGAVADQIENVAIRIGIGDTDLDAQDPTPSRGLTSVLALATPSKLGSLLSAMVVALGLTAAIGLGIVGS